jgi:hypothetical protein
MDARGPRPQTYLMDEMEKHDTIAKVTDRLAARYPDVPLPLVARVVTEEYEALDDSRIRTYIPTLVEHEAKNKLKREFFARPLGI